MTGSHIASKPVDALETIDHGVEVKHCETLDQFWNLVSPIGEYLTGHPPTSFAEVKLIAGGS